MAQSSLLYRFQVELSDIDRGVYKSFDLRTALHPSESPAYLLTRLFAFLLNDREDLAFSAGGLSDPDAPAIQAASPHGKVLLWIEIANPSARKLHRASKAAEQVKVYTYKDPDILLKEIRENDVHRAETIEVYSLDPRFLDKLAERLERTNKWSVLHQDGVLSVTIGDATETAELVKHPV